ncbi:peptidase, M16 family [Leptospira interrogans str. 2003000735]|uniref:Peptidase, M16 family n=1 Tax=Leptospira interrogans serovar Australis str. 200703203 TaxID=1085541 RepID=N1UJB8_LEPIR|nr:pitrilysin family protein [Leptospira interrogans]EMY24982.1 peptidase, M16 family [Leptospira interrogans serovar Australis str. 200703203]EKN88197.1 peptidase, M16 family [Leptospira interrogans str. 2002000624]EKQ36781.1 peptidase, M16 family [Leptospira interrogans str. 2002000621]EKQ48931.1 peptidase, M16 family [Leptospira interrogans str. 2002000623]EMJ69259.1 peptidase, M16 family [Leptospira interrogans str. 2003000735]
MQEPSQIVHRKVLPGGITVLFQKAPHTVSASAGVFVRVGSRHESSKNAGYCHFLEHMLFKDTAKRSAKQQAEDIERVGGFTNAATSREYTYFHVTVAGKHIGIGLELLAEMIYEPLLKQSDIDNEAGVILEELQGYEDSPEDYIHDFYYQNFFPKNSLGRDIIGTRESVSGVTHKSILDFYDTYYHTENMFLSISGNFEPDEIFTIAAKYFNRTRVKKREGNLLSLPKKKWGYFPKKKKLEQVYFILGGEGFAREFHNTSSASLFTHILGGGTSSRLFQKVREEKGLCYHITAYPSSYADVGINSIVCSTSKEKFITCLEIISDEIKSVLDHGISEKELLDAQTNHEGTLSISYEQTESRMNTIALMELYYGRNFSYEERVKEIYSITLEDLNMFAKSVFGIPKLHLSALGNLSLKEEKAVQRIFSI